MSFVSSSVSSRKQHRTQKSSFSFIKGLLLTMIMVGIFVFYSIWSVGTISIAPKKYHIDKGTSLSTLATKFNFNVSSWRYKAWLRLFGDDIKTIPVGTYRASRGTTIASFFTHTLKNPIHNDLTIMILPGWNMWDIDSYLASKGIGKPGNFLQTAQIYFQKYQTQFDFLKGVESLEGFLYPDTYRIRQDATADHVIRTMLRQFDKKIGKEYNNMNTKDAYKMLTLASIVEREERNAKNQPIIAGILSKRVREGIPMGADATVCYGYQKTQKQCTPAFIARVIRNKNPYNTRNMQGYPPTPISNVPLQAWKATTNPKSSPYYYYLHDPSGQIHYGRNNQEHIVNKQKYLR